MSDILGAIIGSNAQDKAIGAQQKAAQQAIAEQQREYDLSRSDQMPWLTTGGSSLDALAKLYGLGSYQNGKLVPGTGKPDMSGFFTSPDYNFRLNQGIAGVDAGASATGSLDSGATRKAEIGYAGNLASGEFGNYVNRLLGIAGLGQTSANQLGALGANTGNQISQIYQNEGNNLASSYLAQGKLWGDTAGSLFGNLFGGGMGGGSAGSGLIQSLPAFMGAL